MGAYVKQGEIPFESERERMSVMAADQQNRREIYVKGAPDVVLPLCRYVEEASRIQLFNPSLRQSANDANDSMAEQALRVLAVAYRPAAVNDAEELWERDLVLLGLVGMIDPPRPEGHCGYS
jgi:Ca2+-transporting ATPase